MNAPTEKPVACGGAQAWRGFAPGRWQGAIDVRDFIVRNVTPYDGDEAFLAGPSARTKAVWDKLQPYFAEERKKGVLDVDAATPSTLLAHAAGLHRSRQRGDRRPADRQAVPPRDHAVRRPAHGRERPEGRGLRGRSGRARDLHASTARRTTTACSMPIRRRSCAAGGQHIITGLPDAYGRGRIIGDYRRVALYGIDRLLAAKRAERAQVDDMWPTEDVIRTREELAEQMRALDDLRRDGPALRLRHLPARPQTRARGRAVDLSRLSRRDQGGERRGDVDRPHLDLPRHLHRARHRARARSTRAARRS